MIQISVYLLREKTIPKIDMYNKKKDDNKPAIRKWSQFLKCLVEITFYFDANTMMNYNFLFGMSIDLAVSK